MFKQKRTELKNLRIEECRLFLEWLLASSWPWSCPTPTAAAVEQVQWAVVRCCKCLFWMISLGACIRFFLAPVVFCAYFILTYSTLWKSTSLSPKFFTKWAMWMAAGTWFNTTCSKLWQLDFNPKQLVCNCPKPYFRVIPLFPWIMKAYKSIRAGNWELDILPIHMGKLPHLWTLLPIQKIRCLKKSTEVIWWYNDI